MICIGLFSLVTSLVPRWHGVMRWRHGAKLGLLSRLGFIAVFTAGGTLAAFQDLLPAVARALCAALLLLGMLLALIGYWRDPS